MMLSNHSIKHIEERIVYYTESLKKYPKWEKLIKKDLQEVLEMKKEAKARLIVGEDSKGNKAYIRKGALGAGEWILYVEERPTGWLVRSSDIREGYKKEVVYDGGTSWTETITFNITLTK